MTDFVKIIKAAQDMQNKFSDIQQQLMQTEVEGKAGAGLVSVITNGKGEVKKINISPSLLKPEEKVVLEDLLLQACKDAKAKADDLFANKFADVTGGMQMPFGMKMPF